MARLSVALAVVGATLLTAACGASEAVFTTEVDEIRVEPGER